MRNERPRQRVHCEGCDGRGDGRCGPWLGSTAAHDCAQDAPHDASAFLIAGGIAGRFHDRSLLRHNLQHIRQRSLEGGNPRCNERVTPWVRAIRHHRETRERDVLQLCLQVLWGCVRRSDVASFGSVWGARVWEDAVSAGGGGRQADSNPTNTSTSAGITTSTTSTSCR